MKKLLMPFLTLFILTIAGCGSDDDASTPENGGDDGTTAQFEAAITGDRTASYSGTAYYETDGGNITVVMASFSSDWVSTSLTFRAPVTQKSYNEVISVVTGTLGENQVAATTSNGEYFFMGESGQATITRVTPNFIHGNFDIDFSFVDGDETINVKVVGSFVADPD